MSKFDFLLHHNGLVFSEAGRRSACHFLYHHIDQWSIFDLLIYQNGLVFTKAGRRLACHFLHHHIDQSSKFDFFIHQNGLVFSEAGRRSACHFLYFISINRPNLIFCFIKIDLFFSEAGRSACHFLYHHIDISSKFDSLIHQNGLVFRRLEVDQLVIFFIIISINRPNLIFASSKWTCSFGGWKISLSFCLSSYRSIVQVYSLIHQMDLFFRRLE